MQYSAKIINYKRLIENFKYFVGQSFRVAVRLNVCFIGG